MAQSSHLRRDNYFYFSCCTGKFARDNCPSWMLPANFQKLKDGAIDRLEIMNGVFMDALRSRRFTKVGKKACQGYLMSEVCQLVGCSFQFQLLADVGWGSPWWPGSLKLGSSWGAC